MANMRNKIRTLLRHWLKIVFRTRGEATRETDTSVTPRAIWEDGTEKNDDNTQVGAGAGPLVTENDLETLTSLLIKIKKRIEVRNETYLKKRHEAQHQVWKDQMPTKLHLSILEQILDPVAAATNYNYHYSYLYRLPDEVLLIILRFLQEDEAAFYFLRQVSRRFRRLINDREFRGHIFSTFHDCWSCSGIDIGCFESSRSSKTWGRADFLQGHTLLKDIISRGLSKDQTCKKCQEGYASRQRAGLPTSCKFASLDNDYLHCSGCGQDHPSPMFSPEQKEKPWRERICIGREGHIRLCEHEVITWADIEPHIIRWDTNPDLDNPRIPLKDCKDSSHIYGCSSKSLGSCTRLNLMGSGTGLIQLYFSWIPHTGRSAFTSFTAGRLLTSEIQTILRKYRRNAACFIVPKLAAGHFPEMECFSPSGCDCLIYETPSSALTSQRGQRTQSLSAPIRQVSSHPKNQNLDCSGWWGGHSTLFFSGWVSSVSIWRCSGWSSSLGDIVRGPPCISTQYEKSLTFSPARSGSGDSSIAGPSHEWYHALDPNSYTWGGGCGLRETCKDVACRNHYPLRADDHHRGAATSRACDTTCPALRSNPSQRIG